jgi:hypothetical protein
VQGTQFKPSGFVDLLALVVIFFGRTLMAHLVDLPLQGVLAKRVLSFNLGFCNYLTSTGKSFGERITS